MDRYESLLAVYQAQNAVQIAQSQGADKYAHETLMKAEQLLADARQMEQRKQGASAVVTAAREAAQTAEDARIIAVKRAHDDEVSGLKAELAQERAKREDAERAAREAQVNARSEQQAMEAPAPAPPVQQVVPPAPRVQTPPAVPDVRKTEARARLLRRMNDYFPTMDTPRGLVITLSDRDFRGPALDPAIAARVGNLAAAIAGQHGLSIDVEGHGEQNAGARAAEVRDTLVRGGLTTGAVTARGLGNARPVAPGNSPQNRRVEIVISGEAIGTLATWDRSYQLR
jgi:flagellar motor protein MotB